MMRRVTCGVTWGFLAIVGLVLLVGGMVIGTIVAVVGIESERKREQATIERAARKVCIAQHAYPQEISAAIYELSKAIDASVEKV